MPIVVSRSKQLSKTHQQALQAGPTEWQGRGGDDEIIIGVLDIDCEHLAGFDAEDEAGLTRIAKLISDSCDW